jgi:hypothetical protein
MFDSIHNDELEAQKYITDREFGGRYYLLYYIYSLFPPTAKDIAEKYPDYQYNYINSVPEY